MSEQLRGCIHPSPEQEAILRNIGSNKMSHGAGDTAGAPITVPQPTSLGLPPTSTGTCACQNPPQTMFEANSIARSNRLRDDDHLVAEINSLVKRIRGMHTCRELSSAITKLQEARMWIEEDMSQMGAE